MPRSEEFLKEQERISLAEELMDLALMARGTQKLFALINKECAFDLEKLQNQMNGLTKAQRDALEIKQLFDVVNDLTARKKEADRMTADQVNAMKALEDEQKRLREEMNAQAAESARLAAEKDAEQQKLLEELQEMFEAERDQLLAENEELKRKELEKLKADSEAEREKLLAENEKREAKFNEQLAKLEKQLADAKRMAMESAKGQEVELRAEMEKQEADYKAKLDEMKKKLAETQRLAKETSEKNESELRAEMEEKEKALAKKLSEMERKLAEAKKKAEQDSEQNEAELKAQLEESEASFKLKLCEMERKLAEAKRKAEEESEQNEAELKAQLEEKEAAFKLKLSEMERKLADSQKRAKQVAEASEAALNAEMAKLKKKLEEAQERNAELESRQSSQHLKSLEDKLEKLYWVNKELISQIKERDSQAKRLQVDFQSLQYEDQLKNMHIDTLDAKGREKDHQREILLMTKRELEETNNRLDRLSEDYKREEEELRKEISVLQRHLDEKEADVAHLNGVLSSWKPKVALVTEQESELDKRRSELGKVQASFLRVKEELEKEKKRRELQGEHHSKELEARQKAQKETKEELETLKGKVEQAKRESRSKDNKCNQMYFALEAREKEIKSLRSRINDLEIYLTKSIAINKQLEKTALDTSSDQNLSRSKSYLK